MNNVDKQYLDNAKLILEQGEVRDDRTGTGTIALFSPPEMRFDLTQGFPMLTTKKLHIPSIVHELVWMIAQGNTNIKYLVDNNIKIWNGDAYRWYKSKGGTLSEEEFINNIKNDESFAKEHGDLGPIYGEQFRRLQKIHLVPLNHLPYQEPKLPNGLEPTIRGVATLGDVSLIKDKEDYKLIYQTWKSMIDRCYNKENDNYKYYGGKGVFVSNEWLVFSNFYEDVKKLPNWELKLEYPNDYSLDKDMSGSNYYSKHTCRWAFKNDQVSNRGFKPFYAYSPKGEKELVLNIYPFAKKHGLNGGNIGECLRGNRRQHKGWTFEYVDVPTGFQYVIETVDQIKKLIAGIKHNPYGRRHIVNAWNPSELNKMALPPCHMFFQVYVHNDGGLSLKMYQRSADFFLGVPFNIAFYSLLTHIIAQCTGLYAKEFIHTLGDAHIYKNHVEQIQLQMTREPKPLPKLILDPNLKDIDDLTAEQIKFEGYDPHPIIRGKVSVG